MTSTNAASGTTASTSVQEAVKPAAGRVGSLDQFRGYAVAVMFVVNF